jgi:hypothetical protein
MYFKRLGKHLWLWHHQSSNLSLMELLRLIHTSTSNSKSSAILLENDTLEILYHHVMVFCCPEDTLEFSWSGIIQNYMSAITEEVRSLNQLSKPMDFNSSMSCIQTKGKCDFQDQSCYTKSGPTVLSEETVLQYSNTVHFEQIIGFEAGSRDC